MIMRMMIDLFFLNIYLLKLANIKIQQPKMKRKLFLPEQVFYWNILMTLLIWYYIFTIPVIFFFRIDERSIYEAYIWENVINALSCCLLLIQMWVRMNSCLYVNGVFTQQKQLIVTKYLQIQLFIDVAAIFAILSYYFQPFYFLRILFFLKLYNLKYYDESLTWVLIYSPKKTTIYNLIKATFYFFVFSNWCACVFFYIDYTYFLNDNYSSLGYTSIWIINNSDLANISSLSLQLQYEYTIYWSFVTAATLGYGDITPKNILEVILLLVIAAPIILLYSYQNQTAFQCFRVFDEKKNTRIRQVQIISRRVGKEKATSKYLNLVCFYAQNTETQQNDDLKTLILKNLSQELRKQLQIQMYSVPFSPFKIISQDLMPLLGQIVELKTYFPQQSFSPNEHFIFSLKGQIFLSIVGNDFCCFQEGIVNIREIPQNHTLNVYNFFVQKANPFILYKTNTIINVYLLKYKDLQYHPKFDKYRKGFRKARQDLLVNQNYKKYAIQCDICISKDHVIDDCGTFTFTPKCFNAKKDKTYISTINMQRTFIRRSCFRCTKVLHKPLRFQSKICFTQAVDELGAVQFI